MQSLRNANLLLAFLIELAMLAGFAYAGWMASQILWLRLGLAIGLPVIAIVFWGGCAAPRSKTRFEMPALLYFKLAMFGLATLAWWLAGEGFVASVFAVLAGINLAAAQVFRQF